MAALPELSPTPLSKKDFKILSKGMVEIKESETPLVAYFITDRNGRTNSKDVSTVTDILCNGNIIEADFISTYGIVGLPTPEVREKIRMAKDEPKDSKKPVSTVAMLKDAIDFIDMEQIHPEFRDPQKFFELGQFLMRLGFLRFPVNSFGQDIGRFAVENGQMQVLFKEDTDPLLVELKRRDPRNLLYLVTSANKTSEIEKYTFEDALKFANVIHTPALVLQSPDSIQYGHLRQKVGSVPILQYPRVSDRNEVTGAPMFKILRSANTDAYSFERALKQQFGAKWGIAVSYEPTKPERTDRPHFSLPSQDLPKLGEILFQASDPRHFRP